MVKAKGVDNRCQPLMSRVTFCKSPETYRDLAHGQGSKVALARWCLPRKRYSSRLAMYDSSVANSHVLKRKDQRVSGSV
jgi:hypothetical protein